MPDALATALSNTKRIKTKIYMEKIQFLGTNADEVKAFCGDECMVSPYFGMGFSMLSIITPDGIVTVNEGDYLVKEDDGSFRTE